MAAAESRPSARERQKIETRQRLYVAALDLFQSKGFDAVQVDEIVRLAGVARGTFYLHYQGKEEVLQAFRENVEESLRQRLQAIEEPDSVEDLFARVVNALLETRENPETVRDLVGLAFRSPATHEWDQSPHVRAIARFIVAFQKRGQIRKDMIASTIGALFIAGVFGFLIGPGAPRHGRRAAIDQFREVFVAGIRVGA
ncbi:MAG: TetR/AcrR family transcriptional regulator [bacterium]